MAAAGRAWLRPLSAQSARLAPSAVARSAPAACAAAAARLAARADCLRAADFAAPQRRAFSASAGDPGPDRRGRKSRQTAEGEAQEAAEERARAEAEEQGSSKGQALSLLGMTGFGLSMIVRNPIAARSMGVLGPVGMLMGGLLSLYEVGGWRLILAIPTTLAGIAGAGAMADGSFEQGLREEAAASLAEGCAALPGDVVAAVRQVGRGREYETNRMSMDLEWRPADAESQRPQWRVEVLATRPSKFRPWTLSTLRAYQAEEAAQSSSAGPPPQSRYWEPNSPGPLTWKLVWQA